MPVVLLYVSWTLNVSLRVLGNDCAAMWGQPKEEKRTAIAKVLCEGFSLISDFMVFAYLRTGESSTKQSEKSKTSQSRSQIQKV
jgi:hypothetical protein